MYWQEIVRRESVRFRADLEHIINFAGFRIISIYVNLEHSGLTVRLNAMVFAKDKFLPNGFLKQLQSLQ